MKDTRKFRSFRIHDDDGNKKLNREEFIEMIHNYGLKMDKKEISDLFDKFDTDKTGTISFDEFLIALRVGGEHTLKCLTVDLVAANECQSKGSRGEGVQET